MTTTARARLRRPDPAILLAYHCGEILLSWAKTVRAIQAARAAGDAVLVETLRAGAWLYPGMIVRNTLRQHLGHYLTDQELDDRWLEILEDAVERFGGANA